MKRYLAILSIALAFVFVPPARASTPAEPPIAAALVAPAVPTLHAVAVVYSAATVSAVQAAPDSTFIPSSADPWWLQLLKLAAIPIIGLLTKYGWDGIEAIATFLKDPTKLNPMIKPFIVVVFGFIIGTGLAHLNVAGVSTDITQWAQGDVVKIIGALFGILIHLADKSGKQKKALLTAGAVSP